MKSKKIIIFAVIFALLVVVLTACSGKAVTVRFFVDGELYQTYRVEEGGYLEDVPEVPERAGRSGKWSVTDFDEIKESIDVYAIYTVNEYTIDFYADGVLIATRKGTMGQNITDIPEVPEKEGYNGVWSINNFANVHNDTDVKAIYTLKTYKATFYGNSYAYEEALVTVGASVPESTYYEKDGYYYFTEDTKFLSGKTYYERKRVAYDTSEIKNGKVVKVPDPPKITGTLGLPLTTKWLMLKDTAAGQTTVDPVYEGLSGDAYYVPYSYATLTLHDEDGTIIDVLKYDVGETIASLPVPENDDEYTDFYGWYKEYSSENDFYFFTMDFMMDLMSGRINVSDEAALKSLETELTFPFALLGNSYVKAKWMSIKHTEGLIFEGNKVTGYTGTDSEIFIPYKYKSGEEYVNVTEIAQGAFANNTGITKINVPGTVKTIGKEAFLNCSHITNVYFPDGCSVEEIKDSAFKNCTSLSSYDFTSALLILGKNAFYGCSALGNLRGEENSRITEIPEGAFAQCNSLVSFTVSESVTAIGDEAFSGDTELDVSFRNADNVTSIGERAFAYCVNFSGVMAKNAVCVGENAFVGCSAISEVTASTDFSVHGLFSPMSETDNTSGKYYSVTVNDTEYAVPKSLSAVVVTRGVSDVVDTYAFYDLYTVKSVIFGNGIEEIAEKAFYVEHFPLSGTAFTVTFNAGLRKIEKEAFAERKDVRIIELPSSLEEIGERAFAGLTSLSRVSVPSTNSLTKVGKYAFEGTEWYTGYTKIVVLGRVVLGVSENYCRNREYYVIPAEDMGLCTTIAPYAFYGNTYLTSVTLGNYISEIGDYAFGDCVNVKKFVFNQRPGVNGRKLGEKVLDGMTAIEDLTAYEDVISVKEDNVITAFDLGLPAHVATLRLECAGRDGTVTSAHFADFTFGKLYLGSDFSIVGEGALSANEIITEVHFGTYLERIGKDAFKNCVNLTIADFSDNARLTVIGESAFENTKISALALPDGLINIDKSAFKNTKIVNLTVPSTVRTIGESSFESVSTLVSVTLPDGLSELGSYAFMDCNIKEFTLPESATNENLGEGVLKGNFYLKSLVLYAGLRAEKLFTKTDDGIARVDIPVNFNVLRILSGKIDDNEFFGFDGLQNVVISNGVTEIGNSAFEGCSSIGNVTVPNTVVKIGERAFADCVSLSRCQIDSNASALKTVGKEVFAGDVALAYVKFPETIESGDWTGMFDGCIKLTTTNFPVTISEIGDFAFRNCESLVTIGMHNYVETIGESAFEGCKEIDFDDVIFDSLTAIGENAFKNCKILHGIKAENASSVGKDAYYGCDSIEEITINEKQVSYYTDKYYRVVTVNVVGEVAEDAFEDCAGLNTVMFYNGDKDKINAAIAELNATVFIDSSLEGEVTGENVHVAPTDRTMFTYAYDFDKMTAVITGFSDAFYALDSFDGVLYLPSRTRYNGEEYLVDKIGAEAFGGKSVIRSVVIPAEITEIGNASFRNCINLESIRFESGSNLKCINNNAFAQCTSLNKIAFPSSLLEIGNNAFESDTGLVSVTFYANSNLKIIGDDAFHGVSNVTSFRLTSAVESIGQKAFYSCLNLAEFSFGNKAVITEIKTSTFSDCPRIAAITIPDTVIEVGSNAFKNCVSLDSITLPDSVVAVGSGAFASTGITSLVLGRSLQTIGASAFEYCGGLTSVTLPDSLVYVGEKAFHDCSAITGLTIGRSVKSIKKDAFSGMSKLVSLNFNAINASDFGDGNGVFGYGGQDSAGISVTVGDDVKRIPAYMFEPDDNVLHSPKLASVAFGADATLNEIGDRAFANCVGLTAFTVPVCTLSVGAEIFYGCTALTVSLEVTSEPACFDENWRTGLGIAPVFGVGNVTSGDYTYVVRGEYAYLTEYLGHDEEVTVPATIDGYAIKDLGASFERNEDVVFVIVSDAITGIGSFYNCTSLEKIIFGDNVSFIRNNAFYGCAKLNGITITENVNEIGENAFYGCVGLNTVYVESGRIASLLYVTKTVMENDEPVTIDVTNDTIGHLTENALSVYTTVDTTINAETYKILPVKVRGYDVYTKLYFDVGKTSSDSVYVYLIKEQWAEEYVLYADGSGEMKEYEARGSMPWYAYADKISTVHVGEDITSLTKNAFCDMTILKNVYYNVENSSYVTDKSLFSGSGRDATELKLRVGDNVKAIPAYLMKDNVYLTEIIYEHPTLTSIGAYAFSGCSGLLTAVVPNTVNTIGERAFQNCANISTITIGTGVEHIAQRAFYGADSLAELNYNATSINDLNGNSSVFHSDFNAAERGEGFVLNVGANVTSVPAYMFYGLTNLILVNVPENSYLTIIGREAFKACDNLVSISIPTKVETIGEKAFEDCSKLSGISFGTNTNLRNIGAEAFLNTAYYRNSDNWTIPEGGDSTQGVLYLNNIFLIKVNAGLIGDFRIKDSVKVVAGKAFEGCNGMTYLRVPAAVEYIGEDAFDGCTSLTTLYLMSKQIVEGADRENSFGGMFEKATHIYVLETLITDQRVTAGIYINRYFVAIEDVITFSSGEYYLYTKNAWNVGATAANDIIAYLVNDERESGMYRLNVKGTGIMKDFNDLTEIPWKNYVTVIDEINVLPGITGIGNSAFIGCVNAAELSLATTITSIGRNAFGGCVSITKLTIPSSVLTIGNNAFGGCTGVTMLNFNPVNMEDLEENNGVFASLGQSGAGVAVYIDRMVTKVPAYLFRPSETDMGVTPFVITVDFKSHNNANACSVINSYAFAGLYELYKVTFPVNSALTEIGDHAFAYCESISAINLTVNVSSIGLRAFESCTALEEIGFNALDYKENTAGNEPFYGAGMNRGLRLSVSNRTKSIPSNLFENSAYLTSIYFEENGVCTKIGRNAFKGCVSVTNVTIPDNITDIGRGAFAGCTGLRSYTAPFIGGKANVIYSSEETLFGYVFGDEEVAGTTMTAQNAGTKSITSYIPNSITTVNVTTFTNIFDGAFHNCKYIQYVYYNTTPTVDEIKYMTEDENGNEFLAGTLDNGSQIKDNAFNGCTALKSVVLPPQAVIIGKSAFQACENLEEITISEKVASIGELAFYDCKRLVNINFNATYCDDTGVIFSGILVTQNIFANVGINANGTTLTFGDNVKRVPAYMFACSTGKSSKLKKIEFGYDSVCTTIGAYAFNYAGLNTLTEINLPSTLKSIGKSAFEETYYYNDQLNWSSSVLYIDNCLIRSISKSAAAYQIANSTYIIADSAFSGCGTIPEIQVPNTVKYIGSYAFSDCIKLKYVQFPETSALETIGSYAFRNCPLLGSEIGDGGLKLGFTVRKKVTSIGLYAFEGCEVLKYIYIDSNDVARGLDGDGYDKFGGIIYYAENVYISTEVESVGSFITNNFMSSGAQVTIGNITYRESKKKEQ